MATLYLRNVPDDVMSRLKRLAARERMSVSALAVRELDEATRWTENAKLLAELPDHDISNEEVLAALDSGRAER